MRTAALREIKRLYHKHGAAIMEQEVRDQFLEGIFDPTRISIKQLAEEFLGKAFIEACDPNTAANNDCSRILESIAAIDSTAFANITGQIAFTTIMAKFNNAAFVVTNTIPTVPTRLSGEKIPGIGQIGDKAAEHHEGMPYEHFGITEEWINTPETKEFALIVPVTKEAIFFDRTNLVVSRASAVGEWLGINKEKRLMNMIIGFGGGSTPTFAGGGKWKYKDTEYAVYNASAIDFESFFYKNLITDVLTDYTDIDVADQLFANARDPITREPIMLGPMLTLMTTTALNKQAKRIVNAIEVRIGAISASIPETRSENPLDGQSIKPISSAYVQRQLIDHGSISAANAAKYWFYGDFAKAFAYYENWPITVSQAPTNSEAEFNQGIVQRFKAVERGTPAVIAPHYVIRSTGAG